MEVSTVSVVNASGTQVFRPIWREPSQILSQIAHIIEGVVHGAKAPPWDKLLILSPSDAEALADEGWTKQDIRRYMYENARLPAWKVRAAGGAQLYGVREKWQTAIDDHTIVPLLTGPEYLLIVIAGGRGSHNSTYVPCAERMVTEEIDKYRPKKWEVLLREAERGKQEA